MQSNAMVSNSLLRFFSMLVLEIASEEGNVEKESHRNSHLLGPGRCFLVFDGSF